MRHGLIAGLLLVVFTAPGIGREPEKPSTDTTPTENLGPAVKMAQEAIDGLKTNGVQGFIDVAFSGRKGFLPKADAAIGAAGFGKLYHDAVARQGKSLGEFELVRTDVVGRSVVRFIYLEKLERGAVIWHLAFYRGEADEWRWVGFRMNESLDAEFRPVKLDETHKDAVGLAQQAVEALKSDGVPKLLDNVLADGKTVIVAERPLAEEGLSSLRAKAIAVQGKPLGEVELVRTEAVGQSVVRFVYLEKCERGAHIWKFTLYRAAREWKWRDLNVSDYGSAFEIAK